MLELKDVYVGSVFILLKCYFLSNFSIFFYIVKSFFSLYSSKNDIYLFSIEQKINLARQRRIKLIIKRNKLVCIIYLLICIITVTKPSNDGTNKLPMIILLLFALRCNAMCNNFWAYSGAVYHRILYLYINMS